MSNSTALFDKELVVQYHRLVKENESLKQENKEQKKLIDNLEVELYLIKSTLKKLI